MKRLVTLLMAAVMLVGLVAQVGGSGMQALAQDENTVLILCSQYLRAEPDDESYRVGRMNPGDRFPALGRWGWWVYIQVDEGLRGWAYDGLCLRVLGDFEALPVLDPAAVTPQEAVSAPRLVPPPVVLPPESQPVTQLPTQPAPDLVLPVASLQARIMCAQNLRSLPGLSGVRLAILEPADGPLTALGRSADARWVFVQTPAGQQGWVALGDCLALNGNVLALAERAPDAFVGPPTALIACAQVMRSLPLPDAPVVRTLRPEDGPLPIAGITAEAGWLYLELPDGTAGWTVNAFCLSVLGRVWDAPRYAEGIIPEVTLPPDTTPYATLACSQYLRAAPSMEAERLAIMYPADGLYTVTGRSADDNWLHLTSPTRQGWAARDACLLLQGDVMLAPVLEPQASAPPSALLVCDQYLRAGPDVGADALDPMSIGTRLTLLARSEDSAWVHVSKTDGTQGWTALGSCLSVSGNVAGLPVMARDAGEAAPAAALSCTQYLRAAPQAEAPVLRRLDGTEGPLTPIGRTTDGGWVQLALTDGTQGWAAAGFCVNVSGNFYALPVTEPQPVVYSGPPAADVVCSLNLRRTPTGEGTILTVLGPDSGLYNLIGRTQDLNWLLLEDAAGQVGWAASGRCLLVQGSIRETPVIEGPADRGVWTVLLAAGACAADDPLAGRVAAYNRSGAFAPVSRACMPEADALAALAANRAEFAVVYGGCPGFDAFDLGGGQMLCVNPVRQTQVDDFLAYLAG